MDGFDEIKQALESILGVQFEIEDLEDTLEEEKIKFSKMINHLEKLVNFEHSVFESSHIDLSTITQKYWLMLEETLEFCFSKETSEVIWWYVHDRKNAAGDILGWEDEDGTEYKFATPADLYEFIMFKFGF